MHGIGHIPAAIGPGQDKSKAFIAINLPFQGWSFPLPVNLVL